MPFRPRPPCHRAAAGAGSALSATAAYDGIGTPTYENLSVDLLFEHKF